VAWAIRTAPTLGKDSRLVVCLSGRGDKDADYVAKLLGL
jgi:tryptophan synthase beta chain